MADYERALKAFDTCLASDKDPQERIDLREGYARAAYRAKKPAAALEAYTTLLKEDSRPLRQFINNLMVFMTDSTDHVSGKTGLTLALTASKDGAAFASITPTVLSLVCRGTPRTDLVWNWVSRSTSRKRRGSDRASSTRSGRLWLKIQPAMLFSVG
jgi:hypothetical protein